MGTVPQLGAAEHAVLGRISCMADEEGERRFRSVAAEVGLDLSEHAGRSFATTAAVADVFGVTPRAVRKALADVGLGLPGASETVVASTIQGVGNFKFPAKARSLTLVFWKGFLACSLRGRTEVARRLALALIQTEEKERVATAALEVRREIDGPDGDWRLLEERRKNAELVERLAQEAGVPPRERLDMVREVLTDTGPARTVVDQPVPDDRRLSGSFTGERDWRFFFAEWKKAFGGMALTTTELCTFARSACLLPLVVGGRSEKGARQSMAMALRNRTREVERVERAGATVFRLRTVAEHRHPQLPPGRAETEAAKKKSWSILDAEPRAARVALAVSAAAREEAEQYSPRDQNKVDQAIEVVYQLSGLAFEGVFGERPELSRRHISQQ